MRLLWDWGGCGSQVGTRLGMGLGELGVAWELVMGWVGLRRGEGTVMAQVGGWRWDGILFADGVGVGAVVGLGLRLGVRSGLG